MTAGIKGEPTAQDVHTTPEPQVPTQSEEPSGDQQLTPPDFRMERTETEYNVIDLYAIEGPEAEQRKRKPERPFVHEIQLHGPSGETVWTRAVFDSGAMISAMCTTIFEQVRHRLAECRPSTRVLRMANGAQVKSLATWTGTVELEGIKTQNTFEIFDSGGGWSFLFGKPMLWAFHALHNFRNDTVTLVRNKNQVTVLTNQIDHPYYATLATRGLQPALDWKQHRAKQNRTVPAHKMEETKPVMTIEDGTERTDQEAQWTEIPTDQLGTKGEPFTRQTMPFNPKRIEAI